jgi:hypothetical protein
MAGSSKPKFYERTVNTAWWVEWVLPGLFAMILLGCLAHLGYCALQGAILPSSGFHYAISAFAS